MAPKRKRKLKPRLRRLERREDGRNDDPDSDHDLEDHEEDHDQEDHDLLEDTGKEESPAAEENLGAAEKVIVDASTDSPAGRVKKRRRRVRAEHHSQGSDGSRLRARVRGRPSAENSLYPARKFVPPALSGVLS